MRVFATMSDLELGIRAFLQLGVILLTCRVFGWLGRRFLGQTQVVSEMIAGVFLGPSVLKFIAPEFQQWLFPTTMTLGGQSIRHPSIQILYVMSQVGLALYMFLVGMEFDVKLLKQRSGSAALVSFSGILAPFGLGALIAMSIHDDPRFFPPNLGMGNAVLYLGAAMCITAFPMLARIIVEKALEAAGYAEFRREQARLKWLFEDVTDRGVPAMLSNSPAEWIVGAYEADRHGFHVERTPARRAINSRGDRRGAMVAHPSSSAITRSSRRRYLARSARGNAPPWRSITSCAARCSMLS